MNHTTLHLTLITSLMILVPCTIMSMELTKQQDAVTFCAVCQDEAPLDTITFTCTHTVHKECIESYYQSLSFERQLELKCIVCNQLLTPEDYTKINLEVSPEEALISCIKNLLNRLRLNLGDGPHLANIVGGLSQRPDTLRLLGPEAATISMPYIRFLGQLTPELLRDPEHLYALYQEHNLIPPEQVVILLKNCVDHWGLNKEHCTQFRRSLGAIEYFGGEILTALGPLFDDLEKLVDALANMDCTEISPLFEHLKQQDSLHLLKAILRLTTIFCASIPHRNPELGTIINVASLCYLSSLNNTSFETDEQRAEEFLNTVTHAYQILSPFALTAEFCRLTALFYNTANDTEEALDQDYLEVAHDLEELFLVRNQTFEETLPAVQARVNAWSLKAQSPEDAHYIQQIQEFLYTIQELHVCHQLTDDLFNQYIVLSYVIKKNSANHLFVAPIATLLSSTITRTKRNLTQVMMVLLVAYVAWTLYTRRVSSTIQVSAKKILDTLKEGLSTGDTHAMHQKIDNLLTPYGISSVPSTNQFTVIRSKNPFSRMLTRHYYSTLYHELLDGGQTVHTALLEHSASVAEELLNVPKHLHESYHASKALEDDVHSLYNFLINLLAAIIQHPEATAFERVS